MRIPIGEIAQRKGNRAAQFSPNRAPAHQQQPIEARLTHFNLAIAAPKQQTRISKLVTARYT